MKYNTAIFKLINLKYSGTELKYHLRAWEKFPTLKTDCRLTAQKKEAQRLMFVERLKKEVNLV